MANLPKAVLSCVLKLKDSNVLKVLETAKANIKTSQFKFNT